ncbi:MAG: chemotaxis response regulator protein-glutamate methylesterase [Dehalococcoidia bacterium]
MVSPAPNQAAPVRVLVVDDSATVRAVLAKRLDAHPEIEVIGRAVDGLDAIEQVKRLKPDVVTLDVEMPRLDGLGTLKRLMEEAPTRVVMVSSLTGPGAQATLQALELGAVDFIEKPASSGISVASSIADEVSEKVRDAVHARLRPRVAPKRLAPPAHGAGLRRWQRHVVMIAASTGGPPALRTVITSLPADLGVPVLVVQHMPRGFTKSLAERLDEESDVKVEEAERGSRLAPGKVLLAPGGFHMTVDSSGVIDLNEGPTECGVRPAANVTMESVVDVYGRHVLGVVLTGMGSDGTRGAGLIKDAGGSVIVEDEASCVVYGMPRSVARAGFADAELPLEAIATAIVDRSLAAAAA